MIELLLIVIQCNSNHEWALKKWSLNTGPFNKGACIVWLSFGTSGSGHSRQEVTEYK